MKLFAAVAVALLLAVSVVQSAAQEDLAKVLVGKWEGQIQGESDSPERTLVIKSVKQQDGKWTAEGTYGNPKRNQRPVDIAIEKLNNEVVLKFTSSGRAQTQITLTLHKDGKHLLGSMFVRAGRRGGNEVPVKLQKVE